MNALRFKYIFRIMISFVRSIPARVVQRNGIKMNIRQCWEATPYFRLSNNGEITIGKEFHPRKNVFLKAPGGRIQIGDKVFMNHNVCITSMGHIHIGDGTTIANNVVIVDHDHDFKSGNAEKFKIENIYIGDRVWIGANCTILKGTTIGNDSVIAAGSTVRGVIPQGSLFYQKRETCCEIIKRQERNKNEEN